MKNQRTDRKLPRPMGFMPLLLTLLALLAWAHPVTAQTTTALLEKGVYTEETVGDLQAAIDIYRQIIEADAASRSLVAQAHFRLAMCHLKTGDTTRAKAALDILMQDFSDQEELVAQAREHLAAMQPDLALGPVPWQDGEFLTYQMSLPTGKIMGSLFLMATSAVVDGQDAWQLQVRRFAFGQADNYGVSRTFVEAATQRPIRSSIRHGILGQADATYGPEGVTITSGGNETVLDVRQQVYDNDQSMHHMRLLPLAPGYQAKIDYLPIWTQQVIEVSLNVVGIETCQVPAGTFECFKVALDIGTKGQTLWISTGPERFPIKVLADGVNVELTSIAQTDVTSPVAFALEDFGFSGALPADWLFHVYRARPDKAMIRFLDPEAAAVSSLEVDRCPPGRCPTLKETAERELKGARRRFRKLTLREGSWSERTLDGRPAISFVSDYEKDDAPWVQYRWYTLTDDLRLELIFRTPAERFEALRPTFDAVAESLRAR